MKPIVMKKSVATLFQNNKANVAAVLYYIGLSVLFLSGMWKYQGEPEVASTA
jgi:hypothetical protein